ncbi:MAG TPA: DUF1127 domain-containing protein [Amaricoccus sp.]|jgi:uncharacterized protein YjiS (DUF1127 family)|nr:DUF1127 domain-containing protein [Amaricoccus sp.]
MSMLSLQAAARRQRSGPGAWAAGALAFLVAAESRHRDRTRLAAMSEHLLADIGLTRDAVRVARGRLDR